MLPGIKKASGIGKTVQVAFGGIDLRPEARDGTFQYMEGIAPDRYPILEGRALRDLIGHRQTYDMHVLGLAKALITIEDGFIYYNSIFIGRMGVQGTSQMVAFGSQVIETGLRELIHTEYDYKGHCDGAAALPQTATDGDAWSVTVTVNSVNVEYVYLRVNGAWINRGPVVEPLETEVSADALGFVSDTYQGEPANLNTIYADNGAQLTPIDFRQHFKAGDAVTISGCTVQPANNQTLIVREVTAEKLRFYEDSFRMPDISVFRVHADGGLPKQASGTDIVYQIAGYAPYAVGDCFKLPSDVSQGWYLVSDHHYGESDGYVLIYDEDGTLQATITIDPYSWIDPETLTDDPVQLTFEPERGDTSTGGYLELGTVTISRKWPDGLVHVFEDSNRLWGWKGRTIYASKLGDPGNWFSFDGLAGDSWSVDIHRPEMITGGISLHGYPAFYTENRRYLIYGSEPAAYQIAEQDCFGVREGCSASMAIVDGELFYVSRHGIMTDTGSIPACVSEALGALTFRTAAGGAFKKEYWVSGVLDTGAGPFQSNDAATFVLNTATGAWYHDAKVAYGSFASAIGTLAAVYGPVTVNQADYFEVVCLRGDWPLTPSGTEESREASLRTNIYTMEQPNRKRVHRIQIRGRFTGDVTTVQNVTVDRRLAVYIRYDGQGDPVLAAEIAGTGARKSFYLPILPRRCDHFELYFEGSGDWAIESLALETRSGSAIF